MTNRKRKNTSLKIQEHLRKKKSVKERAYEKVDINLELNMLESMIGQLKADYERYFQGLTELRPDKLHTSTKRQFRKIQNAPFKKTRMKHRLITLESRYQTYNNYWERVIKEKEAGTYYKDIFRAELRGKYEEEMKQAHTKKGKGSKQMQALFDSYRNLLEQNTGKKQNIDFQNFQKSLVKHAKAHRAKYGNAKFSFQVVVKDGKVAVKAKKKN